MFPLLIHDMIYTLESLGYRIEYGTNSWGEPFAFVRNAPPGVVVDTLKLTQSIYERSPTPKFPHTLRSCYTALGIMYFDFIDSGTRMYLPTQLSEVVQESNRQIFQALNRAKSSNLPELCQYRR